MDLEAIPVILFLVIFVPLAVVINIAKQQGKQHLAASQYEACQPKRKHDTQGEQLTCRSARLLIFSAAYVLADDYSPTGGQRQKQIQKDNVELIHQSNTGHSRFPGMADHKRVR